MAGKSRVHEGRLVGSALICDVRAGSQERFHNFVVTTLRRPVERGVAELVPRIDGGALLEGFLNGFRVALESGLEELAIGVGSHASPRSEEHTSELQSRVDISY